jgi:hypothetical protein
VEESHPDAGVASPSSGVLSILNVLMQRRMPPGANAPDAAAGVARADGNRVRAGAGPRGRASVPRARGRWARRGPTRGTKKALGTRDFVSGTNRGTFEPPDAGGLGSPGSTSHPLLGERSC